MILSLLMILNVLDESLDEIIFNSPLYFHVPHFKNIVI